uniref:Uncharacterized protein n=1 Tax=Mycena chlorophos TaxID=658473 RepID=A0ABQ0LES6_MYCCL|nr:predicted protein [Mycena chlorophos]
MMSLDEALSKVFDARHKRRVELAVQNVMRKHFIIKQGDPQRGFGPMFGTFLADLRKALPQAADKGLEIFQWEAEED